MEWQKVIEVFVGSLMAFLFGLFLQCLLLWRQEVFQKQMLKKQQAYQDLRDAERATNDQIAAKQRLETERTIAAIHVDALKSIAMADRNLRRNPHSG